MARRSFLDKFTGSGKPASHSEQANVLRNLEAILNTREGYGYFVRGFGLGEYTEKRGTRALLDTLTKEIQGEIEKHEPRLSQVEVTLLGKDSALSLQFEVTAVLAGAPLELLLRFDTVTAHVRVERKE